ncbi:hypothetical protein FOZ61_007426, partial [Perkinsus olseni]
GGLSLEPGRYCAFPVWKEIPQRDDIAGCMFFDYKSESSAEFVYTLFTAHFFAMRYDNVTFEDDKIILKRYGHIEGPEVYPYFDVGFDLKVTSDTPDVVEMVAKDGTYAYTLTRGCTPPPGTYQSGYSGYKLEEGSSGEIFKFNNPYVKVTSQFVKIPAEFVYDSTRNVVSFVPNNKSLPHIDAPLQQ